MIVTKIKLQGSNGEFKIITIDKIITDTIGFIEKTEFSDFKVIESDVINLGTMYEEIQTILYKMKIS